MGNWDLHQIEQAFAAAAIDSSAWGRALEALSAQSGSFGAILFPVTGKPFPGVPMSESMREPSDVYFRDEWHLRDERYRGIDVMKRRGVYDDSDIIDSESIKRHPYYQEFLAPLGLSGFVGVKMASGDNLWCISVQRRTIDEPFSVEDRRKLALLSPVLSSTTAVARALGFAASDAALDAFEISDTAALLLDQRGEVIKLNGPAERLLGGDVRIERKRLVVSDTGAMARLDRALHGLLWTSDGAALSPPVGLPRQGKRPLLAHPMKLANLSENPFSDGRAILILIDPDQYQRPPESPLQDIFRLTAAEARLATRLAAGDALESVADEFGIAKETARHHLKKIFVKTGVRRQAELVALLSRLLPQTGDQRRR